MIDLIRAERLKLFRSSGYKILLIIGALIGVAVGVAFIILANTNLELGGFGDGVGTDEMALTGHLVYLNSLPQSQIAVILVSIFAAVFVANEFGARTLALGLKNGCKRKNILLSKLIVFVMGIIPIVFVIPLMSSVVMSIGVGFGESFNAETITSLITNTGLYFMGHIAYGVVVFMLAVLTKNAIGTIGGGIGLFLALEFFEQIASVLEPLESLTDFVFVLQLRELPNITSMTTFFIGCAVFLAGAIALSLNNFQKTDLK